MKARISTDKIGGDYEQYQEIIEALSKRMIEVLNKSQNSYKDHMIFAELIIEIDEDL